MPQWSVTFPNLLIHTADMTHTHGVSPSVCHVIATPQSLPLTKGVLEFREDGNVLLRFKECAIFRAAATPPKVRRGVRMELDIYDRRWKWRYRYISGRYNRRDSCANIIPTEYASLSDLIHYLMQALGEATYNITLPEITLEPPFVDWDHTRADLALEELATYIGCIITLGYDDIVSIVPIGDGPTYPAHERQRTPTVDFLSQVMPYEIAVVFAPTVYQQKIECEAVAQDRDGQLLPLKYLHYASFRGFAWDPWYVPGTSGLEREGAGATIKHETEFDDEWAMENVYKWYRIKEWYPSIHVLPNGDRCSNAGNILPLMPDIATLDLTLDYTGPGKDPAPYPYATVTSLDNTTGLEYTADHTIDFDLDIRRGLIKFDDYTFRYTNTTDDAQEQVEGSFSPADVHLTCAFHARATDTDALYRFSVKVRTNSSDEKAGFVLVEYPWAWMVVTQAGTTNESDLREIAHDVAYSYGKHYRIREQSWVQWTGVVAYPPAGNILEMRWIVDQLGAFTYGGKNMEHPLAAPTWRERRLRELISTELP